MLRIAGTIVVRRAGRQRLVHGERGIEPRGLVLREVLHHHLVAFGARAGVGRFLARQHAHQRGLAGAVVADERDAIAALDVQVDVVEHDLVAVRLARVLQLEHHAAALGRGGELEVDALALGRHLEALDLLEHLDAALHLRRLGRLVAEAVDELLDALDLLVLPPLGLAQPLERARRAARGTSSSCSGTR